MKFWIIRQIWPWRSRSIIPENNGDLNQGILHIWSKFGDPGSNGWQVMVRPSPGLTHRQRQRQYPKTKTCLGQKCWSHLFSHSTHIWRGAVFVSTLAIHDLVPIKIIIKSELITTSAGVLTVSSSPLLIHVMNFICNNISDVRWYLLLNRTDMIVLSYK